MKQIDLHDSCTLKMFCKNQGVCLAYRNSQNLSDMPIIKTIYPMKNDLKLVVYECKHGNCSLIEELNLMQGLEGVLSF